MSSIGSISSVKNHTDVFLRVISITVKIIKNGFKTKNVFGNSESYLWKDMGHGTGMGNGTDLQSNS